MSRLTTRPMSCAVSAAASRRARPVSGGPPGRGHLGPHRGTGPAQRHGHRLLGGVQRARHLAGGEAEHVPEHQHGPGPRREQLQRGDERQRYRLAPLDPRLRTRVVVRQAVQQHVRVGLQPGHRVRAGRRRAAGGQAQRGLRPPGRGAQLVQAGVGGHPVQPGPDGRPGLERGQAAPGREQRLLQGIIRVVEGTEHPVAVHVQLAPVRLGPVRRMPRRRRTGPAAAGLRRSSRLMLSWRSVSFPRSARSAGSGRTSASWCPRARASPPARRAARCPAGCRRPPGSA